MQILLRIILLIIINKCVLGQAIADKTKTGLRYSSINQAGVLNGDAGQSVTLQTINGVAVAKWFGGIGIGLDYYQKRSVPLFADVRYHLKQSSNSPFVYLDGGINLPWLTNSQQNEFFGTVTSKNGFYADAGLGWKILLKGESALLLSAGYNYKQTRQNVVPLEWWLPRPSSATQTERYNFEYRRIVIKLGWQF